MTTSESIVCAHCGYEPLIPILAPSTDRRTVVDLAGRGFEPFAHGLRELVGATPQAARALYDHLTAHRGICHACGGAIPFADVAVCSACGAANLQWLGSEPQFPCPACGFVTLTDAYGSYEICVVCGWEDDAVQLANPTSKGGANRESLADAQRSVLARFPLDIRQHAHLARSAQWRPLTDIEIELADRQREARHWHTRAVFEPEQAYWNSTTRC